MPVPVVPGEWSDGRGGRSVQHGNGRASVRAIATIEDVVQRLDGKRSGTGWIAKCPVHKDEKASLSIGVGSSGKTLLHCHAGCAVETIAAAANLTMVDLQPERTVHGKRQIVATYGYTDEQRALLYQSVRFDPKDFRQRRPDGVGGWIYKLGNVRRVLFGLSELRDQQVVYIPEGEKDVLALRAIGLVATTNAGGAGKWRAEYTHQLHAAGVESVVPLPDNDEPGRKHAHDVATSCQAAGLIVKIVELPGLPAKGDVSDWLAAGHTKADLIALVKATALFSSASRVVAVDLAGILDALVLFIRRFVVMSDEAVTAVAVWVAHTYVFAVSDCTPYVIVKSATKRAGKTRLFEVLECLVRLAWFTGHVSAAALLRKIDKEQPTLLLDESDAAFKFESDYTEAVRGLLNSGYRKGGKHSLCTGQGASLIVRDFSTFCPKAFAGIGDVLPDTVTDRSMPIELRRRAAGEVIERFRLRTSPGEAAPLAEALAAWAGPAGAALADAAPELPDALNDRAQDVWEPLIAIADLAGAGWPARIRTAAVALAGQQPDDNDIGVELLKDIKAVLDDLPEDADAIKTAELLKALNTLSDRPWPTFSKDKELTGHALARLLKLFGIVCAGSIRFGTATARGYRRSAFDDAVARYLVSKRDSVTTSIDPALNCPKTKRDIDPFVTLRKTPVPSMNTGLCRDVTLSNPDLGDEGESDKHFADVDEMSLAEGEDDGEDFRTA